MSGRRVIVVGAGVAGTAAALAAVRAGAKVTIVDGGPPASSLMSGAVDHVLWERADAVSSPLPDSALWREILESFGLWSLRNPSALIASPAGMLRPSRGADRALLDLEPMRNARIAVPRVPRAAFDADLLARGWNADPLASARGLRFQVIECEGLLLPDELTCSDNDIARAFDAAGRVQAAADRLRGVASAFTAILVGPWLGVETDAAAALRAALGIPVGETLSMLSGPAGARFESSRDRALASCDVNRVSLAVESLHRDRVWSATLADGSSLEADAVVIAIGGMISGGIALTPAEAAASDEFPAEARMPFSLSVRCEPLFLRAGLARAEVPGSLQGPNLEDYAWPVVPEQRAVFERVGIDHDGSLRAIDSTGAPIPGCFVAGAAAADVMHTVVAAIDTGARAGALAASGIPCSRSCS